ncbi:CD209 antigen-like protein E isoform X1 [Monodelphis domestica]|uniref:CD209 antigen-like protein E isoform X1 n=1 Tax=Monodelphis domestica TaxID=13616 RepID=UPI0024E1FE9D|nr:CD209 antigen-like protein E isoform X1 [Monodelphis domestica]
MCDPADPKPPELAGLDEDALMPSGWSHFSVGTQRSWSARSFPAPWLRRLGFPLLLAFFVLSFILSIITLTQVFQNQRLYNSEQEAVQEKLNQLSAQLKGDQDLRDKGQLEASQFIEQLNKTLNLKINNQLEASKFTEQLNKTLSALCRPCPCQWKFYKDSCYYFSVAQASWETARKACEADGTNLAIISSSEEQNYLKLNLDSNRRPRWIGLSDKKKEGTWHWVDETALGQSFWNEGEPNNAGDEDCCELIPNGWNDAPCSKENYWICEKKASPCPML